MHNRWGQMDDVEKDSVVFWWADRALMVLVPLMLVSLIAVHVWRHFWK